MKAKNAKRGQTMRNYYKPTDTIRIRLDADHAERIRARAEHNRRKMQDQAAYELMEFERGME